MSRIDALIADLCPEGVHLDALGAFAERVPDNGLSRSAFAESVSARIVARQAELRTQIDAIVADLEGNRP